MNRKTLSVVGGVLAAKVLRAASDGPRWPTSARNWG
jgi:hypothetical protein